MKLNSNIVITGGHGRFATVLKKTFNSNKIFYPNKNQLNILSKNSITNYLKRIKPKIIIHLAGLSRPMKIHDYDLKKSINLNIIGTCNIVTECVKKNIKLIYFSTNYVYPCKKGSYKETDPLLPINNYAWSKLGGECAVQMYKNSLILRVSMTENPFVHKYAYSNVTTNFLYHYEVANILPKLLKCRGILNIGGVKRTIYNFAKKDNVKIKKKISRNNIFLSPSINTNKLKQIIRKIK